MPALPIAYRDEYARLPLEQAIAYLAQLRPFARTAPGGAALRRRRRTAGHRARGGTPRGGGQGGVRPGQPQAQARAWVRNGCRPTAIGG